MSSSAIALYEKMDTKPVINALGPRTLLGGSQPHPDVISVMGEAGRYYADMDELLIGSGKVISEMIDCSSALVTSGCAAALVLGTAACVTGKDAEKMSQLPNMDGLKQEVVIQASQRYKYDRVVRMVGVKIVTAGKPGSTSRKDLEDALNDNTAAVLFPDIDSSGDILSLEDVISIAHDRDIPVIVDSAYRVFPTEMFQKFSNLGADLFGFGAKYFGAPNSTGLLCGREDLVEAARLHSFSGFEKMDLEGFGRPFKVDRQEVFGVVEALRIWLDTDHDHRFESAQIRANRLASKLSKIGGISVENTATGLRLILNEISDTLNGDALSEILKSGSPSIWTDSSDNLIHFDMLLVNDGDEMLIADKVKIGLDELKKAN